MADANSYASGFIERFPQNVKRSHRAKLRSKATDNRASPRREISPVGNGRIPFFPNRGKLTAAMSATRTNRLRLPRLGSPNFALSVANLIIFGCLFTN